eukprot:CAMPEP_0116829672 /NCGR_PEP_ID=MMETSP0418-20121206/4344_1 /TAXON_ID=1158023 /ORGANISM="Astrosyne radiata, Strain 13vi08-1A" /LENGTH=645 /DNA_ID=CAMNT_0004458703 /DNA_START=132 /DNA_END=2069 /DNA_ORIENTATION=+
MTSSLAATETITPNWRTFAADAADEELETQLSIHEVWSESQYNESLALYDRLIHCEDSYVASMIQEALDVLSQAFRLYGPNSVVCSFNGGKDAVVILHLARAAHAHYYRTNPSESPPIRPRLVYFDHDDEFPEIISLLQSTVETYDLDMMAFKKGTRFAEGLTALVHHNFAAGCPQLLPMAFVLGTRFADPNASGQGSFAPSSMNKMPPFMRVNPILKWTYGHVWHVIRLFKFPYCVLYDQGYTSLGTTKDTFPCPALAVPGSSVLGGVPKYWPAYMLRDWDDERAGRIKKKSKKEGSTNSQVPRSLSQTSLSHQSSHTDLGASEKKEMENEEMPPESVQASRAPSSFSYSFSSNNPHRSVGLLVIGDEILKGLTTDTNTQAAAKALWSKNVHLAKVVLVSDDQDEIVKEIQRLEDEVDVLITSGGVGPTHDDVTIKSVAAALDCDMVLHEEMANLLREKMTAEENNSTELTEAQKKMATLPSNAKLRYLTENKMEWPVLQCGKIFVLPGVPQFFEKKIQNLAAYLSSQLERSVNYKVVLGVDEASIVPLLNAAVKRHPDVIFGSYPFVGQPDVKTVLTLEGRIARGLGMKRNSSICLDLSDFGDRMFTKERMDSNVRAALDELIGLLPEDSILRVDNHDGSLFS